MVLSLHDLLEQLAVVFSIEWGESTKTIIMIVLERNEKNIYIETKRNEFVFEMEEREMKGKERETYRIYIITPILHTSTSWLYPSPISTSGAFI